MFERKNLGIDGLSVPPKSASVFIRKHQPRLYCCVRIDFRIQIVFGLFCQLHYMIQSPAFIMTSFESTGIAEVNLC